MLVDAHGMLSPRADELLAVLPDGLRESASTETNAASIELQTAPHDTVAGAAGELAEHRSRLLEAVRGSDVRVAAAGTHPLATPWDAEVSEDARYAEIHDAMRELARREPTFALHVHVGLPDPHTAIRVLDGLRAQIPLLLALSASSPFWQGRDSGLASARTPIFGAFPRVGLPRHFGEYATYISVVESLLGCGAFPDPSFLWWDVRLQPRYGTVEVRVMDAQSRVEDVATLTALVASLAHQEATATLRSRAPDHVEVLEENRFLALRDGMDASLLEPEDACQRPVAELLGETLADLAHHADELGCREELDHVPALAAATGASRQRAAAAEARRADADGLDELLAVVDAIVADFVPGAPRADVDEARAA